MIYSNSCIHSLCSFNAFVHSFHPFMNKFIHPFAEKLHVEHGDDPVQPPHRGGVGRALQGDLRVRL
jgi:hypothetical protein